VKNVLDTISVGHCQVSGVAFSFDEPGYASLARELFGCEVEYGASWSGFSLPLKAVEVPLKTADPEALREAALVCQRELDALTADESVSARVRRVILAKRDGMPSLEVTARMLHMTPRTLHRRLVNEGTSFRGIIEEVRHTLAVEHLKSGRSSMQEIAYMLGYSDLANFRRAFKRWEAVPPSSLKKALRKACPGA
jgi:AraC-like DNA-binding protein